MPTMWREKKTKEADSVVCVEEEAQVNSAPPHHNGHVAWG